MTSPRAGRLLLAALVCLSLIAAACADSSSDDAATSEDASSSADASAGDVARGVSVSADTSVKPEITLPGGEPPTELVIVDIVEGDGAVIEPGATVTTDYVGVSWTNDGEEFDSSWSRGEPATFGLSQVIAGWTEGLPGMKVGGRRLLIIPPDMAYGASSPSPQIAENDTLVFVIDMVEIPEPPEPIVPGTDTMGVDVSTDTSVKPEISLPAGDPPTELVVVDIVEGDGVEVPFASTVTTHYVGVSWTNEGAQFDASWDNGAPVSFGLGAVIPGWTEGIPGMRVGGRRLLIIPPEMAYGASSPSDGIAANDTLVFVIDMVDVAP